MKDIQGRKPYKDGIKRVKEKLSTLNSEEIEDFIHSDENSFPANFTFAGPQTASANQYGDLEWDLGSYETNIHIDSYNSETGEVKVSMTTTNEFHLSSLTRINGDGQKVINKELNSSVNPFINEQIESFNESWDTNISDINLTSPSAVIPDTENGESKGAWYGGEIGRIVIGGVGGIVTGALLGNNAGESYDMEFTGNDSFNIND